MKKIIKLPLYSINSLINSLEELASNPEVANQYKELLSALNILKDSFMPLIEEFKDCNNMPDIEALIDPENEQDNHGIDWEQRRYELTKAAMQGRVSALDKNVNYRAVMQSIAKDSLKMADTVIAEMKEMK